MDSIERREDIIRSLVQSEKAIKGTEFAKLYGVTRQIIVKDIAILRASGNKIIATPDGYIMSRDDNKVKTVIAVSHTMDQMKDELATIVKYGGSIEDVVVEHSVYGEIKGMLMLKNLNDVNKFIEKYEKDEIKPLSALTNGTHIHTICAESEEDLELIKNELKEKGYLIG